MSLANSDQYSMKMSQQRSFQIQQDDKFFSRLLSKESSMTNPSSRILYYADRPSSIPFLWESQPGTRKASTFCNHHDDHDHDHDHLHVPPLTPPPSYYFRHKLVQKLDNTSNHRDRIDHRGCRHRHKRSRSSSLLSSLFPKKFKIITNFGLKVKASRWVSSSSEGSRSVFDSFTFRSCSTTTTSWFSSSALSFDSRGDEEDDIVGDGDHDHDHDDYDDGDNDDDDDSPNSRMCFWCYRNRI